MADTQYRVRSTECGNSPYRYWLANSRSSAEWLVTLRRATVHQITERASHSNLSPVLLNQKTWTRASGTNNRWHPPTPSSLTCPWTTLLCCTGQFDLPYGVLPRHLLTRHGRQPQIHTEALSQYRHALNLPRSHGWSFTAARSSISDWICTAYSRAMLRYTTWNPDTLEKYPSPMSGRTYFFRLVRMVGRTRYAISWTCIAATRMDAARHQTRPPEMRLFPNNPATASPASAPATS